MNVRLNHGQDPREIQPTVAAGADPGTRVSLYDPVTDGWRRVAPWPPSIAPPDRAWGNVVRAGDRLIVWGAQLVADVGAAARGASYDPTTDAWQALPDVPWLETGSSTAAWTGTELVLFGGCYAHPTRQTRPLMPPAQAAAFDPSTGTWRRLGGAPDVLAAPPLAQPLPVVRRCGGLAFPIGGGVLVLGGNAVPPEGPAFVVLPPFIYRAATA